jgi:LPS-assembly lipoprotein
MKRAILTICLMFVLAACGFQPVYAPQKLADAEAVSVTEIAGRSGYMLRRALLEELRPGLPGISAPATLDVELEERLTRLIFQPDGAASRSSVIASGAYTLTIGERTVTGLVDAETSFAVPDAPYGDISAQTSASDRAMRLLAQKIADDIRLKLSTD